MFESQIFIRLIFLFLLFFPPVFAILTYPPQPPGVLRGCLSGNMMDHYHQKTKQKQKNIKHKTKKKKQKTQISFSKMAI